MAKHPLRCVVSQPEEEIYVNANDYYRFLVESMEEESKPLCKATYKHLVEQMKEYIDKIRT